MHVLTTGGLYERAVEYICQPMSTAISASILVANASITGAIGKRHSEAVLKVP